MIDFSRITTRLFTGGGPVESADIDRLRAVGITHVLDVADVKDDDVALSKIGVGYHNNPTADDGQSKSADWFRVSLLYVWPVLWVPQSKVYIHCAAGINRGPSTLYAVLRMLQWGQSAAKQQIIFARPVCINGIRYAGDADRAIKELGYE